MTEADVNAPGSKYFKMNLFNSVSDRHCRIVVWDGVHEYENLPPDRVNRLLVSLIKMGEFSEDKHFGLVYCGTKSRARSIMHAVNVAVDAGSTNILVLCRNHKLYRQVVDKMNEASYGRMQ
jgi:hypothetical protein